MELHEKLQGLRKSRGMTQEEMAEALYVSRTAISKWESGRGCPNLDSLKEISRFFSITIDELLSADALLSVAEKDKKAERHMIGEMMFGIMDILFLMLIILPLYPEEISGYVYAVNLFGYDDAASWELSVCWIMPILLSAAGVIRLFMTKYRPEKNQSLLAAASIGINVLLVIFMILSRTVYAAILAFLILIVKVMCITLINCRKIKHLDL